MGAAPKLANGESSSARLFFLAFSGPIESGEVFRAGALGLCSGQNSLVPIITAISVANRNSIHILPFDHDSVEITTFDTTEIRRNQWAY